MAYICITDGMLSENCYVLYDEQKKEAAIIDPGFVSDRLLQVIEPLHVKYILLTHGHFDHFAGAEHLRAMTEAPIAAFQQEMALAANPVLNASFDMIGQPLFCHVDQLFEDGEKFSVGSIPVKVLHTPGHTAGGCCYITPEAIFTGDTLMGYSVGRTDLPTGNEAQLAQSLEKLIALPGDPDICGGHGPVTKLSGEKVRNPYI